jgi:flavin-binding protein dodecin
VVVAMTVDAMMDPGDARERVPLWFVTSDGERVGAYNGVATVTRVLAYATDRLYRVPPSSTTGYVARFLRDDVRAGNVPKSAVGILAVSDVSLDDAVRRAVARANDSVDHAERRASIARERRRAVVALANEYAVHLDAEDADG